MKKLNSSQLAGISGGNYCQTLSTILANNCITGGAIVGAQYGWQSANCGSMSTFYNLAAIGCS
jgi:hypothetical protein